ncbi:hypothetical protein [Streptomyces sp. BA2]|uniref:hypothetical protein n=1 Tax=Streptomyces sp. BA2 TaxID=436595 RepID=UPI001F220A0C|nr:hypothetical protein [Streptomyces sp. BA2]
MTQLRVGRRSGRDSATGTPPFQALRTKNLFEAAGIRVRVNREADVDERVNGLLGQVLRETTTNILRHAAATRVRITPP